MSVNISLVISGQKFEIFEIISESRMAKSDKPTLSPFKEEPVSSSISKAWVLLAEGAIMIAGNLAHLQQYGEFCAPSLWDSCSRSLDISIELMNLMIVLTPKCLSITKLNFIYTLFTFSILRLYIPFFVSLFIHRTKLVQLSRCLSLSQW